MSGFASAKHAALPRAEDSHFQWLVLFEPPIFFSLTREKKTGRSRSKRKERLLSAVQHYGFLPLITRSPNRLASASNTAAAALVGETAWWNQAAEIAWGKPNEKIKSTYLCIKLRCCCCGARRDAMRLVVERAGRRRRPSSFDHQQSGSGMRGRVKSVMHF